jgi:hypothetical protein
MNDKLTAIADEIIDSSDGSYDIRYTDEYYDLTLKEQRQVGEIIYDEIVPCESCGWNFHIDSIEGISGHGELCWRCAQDVEDEEEEEDGQPDEAQEWQDFNPDC